MIFQIAVIEYCVAVKTAINSCCNHGSTVVQVVLAFGAPFPSYIASHIHELPPYHIVHSVSKKAVYIFTNLLLLDTATNSTAGI